MRISICDDDLVAIRELKDYIEEYFSGVGLGNPEISEYNRGEDLLEDKTGSDIIFLDIEMPGMSGIETGKRIKDGIVHPVKPMKYWIETLPETKFFQTHRNYIVNMEHVSEFTHSFVNLCKGEYRAFLTKRKYTEFKEAYLLYLEGAR